MTRATTIQARFADEIDEAAERFGDHENMSPGRIVKWLDQFEGDDDVALAVEVIQAAYYLNGTNIRTMTQQLYGLTVSELARRGLGRAAFIAVGSLGAGSGTVARVLRDAIRGTVHSLVSMLELAALSPGDFDAVVFIDDFSGTGDTLEKWWENVETLVRPINAEVFVGLLVLNGAASARIRSFAEIVAVEELDESKNVLSAESPKFSSAQKKILLKYCRKTGCGKKVEAGYGSCALLLAFKHGCPNNSLPILWMKSETWRPLFNRHAI